MDRLHTSGKLIVHWSWVCADSVSWHLEIIHVLVLSFWFDAELSNGTWHMHGDQHRYETYHRRAWRLVHLYAESVSWHLEMIHNDGYSLFGLIQSYQMVCVICMATNIDMKHTTGKLIIHWSLVCANSVSWHLQMIHVVLSIPASSRAIKWYVTYVWWPT